MSALSTLTLLCCICTLAGRCPIGTALIGFSDARRRAACAGLPSPGSANGTAICLASPLGPATVPADGVVVVELGVVTFLVLPGGGGGGGGGDPAIGL